LERGHGVHRGLQGQPLRGSARLAGHDLTAQGPYRLGQDPDPGHQALGRGPLGGQQHYGRPGQDPSVAERIVDLPGSTGIGVKLAQRPAAERGQAGDLVADGERLLEAAHQRVNRTCLLQGLPGPVTVTGGQGGRGLFQGVGEPVEHGFGGLVEVLDGIQREQHLGHDQRQPATDQRLDQVFTGQPAGRRGVAARKIAARLVWTTSTRLPLISRASVWPPRPRPRCAAVDCRSPIRAAQRRRCQG